MRNYDESEESTLPLHKAPNGNNSQKEIKRPELIPATIWCSNIIFDAA
jgi:hypothetical protein